MFLCVPIIILVYLVLYNIFGKEVIYFEETEFIIQKDLFKLKFYNKYEICKIADFTFPVDELTSGEISFIFDNNKINFGIGHDKSELYTICIDLKRELVRLKHQLCV